MGKDIKIWKDEGSFKLRVCGIINVGEKYLISNCDECEFWSYPGGHVMIGENTDDAVMREVLEETGISAKIDKLLAVIQLFFTRDDGKPFHEIGYYYLLNPQDEIKTEDFNLEEDDKGVLRKHQFRWVTIDELEKIDVRPSDLKNVLRYGLERQHILHYEK